MTQPTQSGQLVPRFDYRAQFTSPPAGAATAERAIAALLEVARGIVTVAGAAMIADAAAAQCPVPTSITVSSTTDDWRLPIQAIHPGPGASGSYSG
jgi:hypothetical protein